MWAYLETNWTFFFWLTGETPNSLQSIVNGVQREYLPTIQRGRGKILDFRNQVSYSFVKNTQFLD